MEQKVNKVCPCITELLVAMVGLEALEHNAVQSDMWLEVGRELQRENPKL